jgi:hypothetical protein
VKRIRLTRSIFLHGRDAEEGSIHYLAQPLADDRIAQGSAVHLSLLFMFFARMWFFIASRTKRKRGGQDDQKQ